MVKQLKKMTPKDYEKLGKALEEVYLIGYANPRRFLWFGFLRGIVNGLGIFIGGTIVVALLFFILGQFNDVPLVGPIIQNIVDIIRQTAPTPSP